MIEQITELGLHHKLLHIVATVFGKVKHFVIPLQLAIDMDLCINCIQEELIDDEPIVKDNVTYDLDRDKLLKFINVGILAEFEFQEKQLNNLLYVYQTVRKA